MPTPAEQKALAFLSFVILLGGAVRVVRAGALAPTAASPAEQQALARQATAASSTATRERERKGAKGGKTARGSQRLRRGSARFDSTGLLIEGTGVVSTSGFPPPGPRIDVDSRPRAAPELLRGGLGGGNGQAGGPAPIVDMDVAGVAEIERLPRVGPALARRIVANRDSLGPFGVLSALGRVKGMGPATLQRLARLVTFSGQARR
jgi:competence protein ComEA